MDILILGGTRFLGRHCAEAALQRGHRLTLFNRGRSNPGLFPEVEQIHGDRAADLDRIAGRRWDAVIDTCGYFPGTVAASAAALAATVDRYLFVSSISVYSDFSRSAIDETSPAARLAQPESAVLNEETYGPLKVHCEDAVMAALPDRSLIVRPGLIVGPHDPTDRFTYWPVRVAYGGELLVPDSPQVPVQYIDVRDLAAWAVHALEQGIAGVFNAVGPESPYTLGELLGVCQTVTGVDVTLTWVTPAFLAEHEVMPFAELPLWVPAGMSGLVRVDSSRAQAAGLTFRPVRDTVHDTLAWAEQNARTLPLRAGLDPAREAQLLTLWHAQHGQP